ncbi:MAG: hypothetical protein ACXWG8_18545 [Usitatibacter sp.]
MAGVSRERITIDLRGLAPIIHAHAKARHLTVSAVARLAVVAALESPPLAAEAQPCGESATANQAIKLTVRMRRCVARRLSARARASGLSQGGYLEALIDGTLAPPLAVDHKEAVAALGVSTDHLAAVFADVNDLIRLIRHGTLPPASHFDERMRTLADDVRQHLTIASRLMAELKPAAARRAYASRRQPGSRRINS